MKNMSRMVYMGNGGIRGISEQRRSSYLDRMAGPKKGSSVYVGRSGVSAKTVLAGGGIVGGGTVRVKSMMVRPVRTEKPKAEKARAEVVKAEVKSVVRPRFPVIPPKEEKVEEKPMEAVDPIEASSPKESLVVVESVEPPMDESGNGTKPEVCMTETEERLSDYLGAAEVAVEKANAAAESEAKSEEEKSAETAGVTLPELPFVEGEPESVKKRRKRKGRRARESVALTSEPEAAAKQQ